MGKKKARCSFAARRFPVYNLMKSGKFVINQRLIFSIIFPVLLFDDTKVRYESPPAKGILMVLLKNF